MTVDRCHVHRWNRAMELEALAHVREQQPAAAPVVDLQLVRQ